MLERMERAFHESNPEAPEVQSGQDGSIKHEEGGWITWDPFTRKLDMPRVPPGKRDGLSWAPRPQDDELTVYVGWFHTHPNKASEGYSADPSPSDLKYTLTEKVPGLIRTHEGLKEMPYPPY